MSFNYEPDWTQKIVYPDVSQYVCPECGEVAFNAQEVSGILKENGAYELRHIADVLVFTCGNPKCPMCDEDFEYEISAVITATNSKVAKVSKKKSAVWFDYQQMPSNIQEAYRKVIGSRANDSFIEWYWESNDVSDREKCIQEVQNWFTSCGFVFPQNWEDWKDITILVKYWW